MRRILFTVSLFAGLLSFGPCSRSNSQVAMSYNRQSGTVPITYFGLHIGYNSVPGGSVASGYSGTAPAWPTLFTVGTDRLWGDWGTSWAEINQYSGTYTWTQLDAQVAAGQANGVTDFIYTFGRTPTWASSNSSDSTCSGNPPYTTGYTNGGCDAPASLSSLTNFANALVQRYCGVIKYYEAWNEPNGSGFWNSSQSPSALYNMIAAEYTAVHSTANCACLSGTCSPGLSGGTNPNSMLSPPLSNPYVGSTGILRSLVALGAAQYFDVAAYHHYSCSSAIATCYLGDVSAERQYFYGLLNSKVQQVWATEGGYGQQSSAPGIPSQMSFMARTYLTLWPTGISRFAWYMYDNQNNNGSLGPWGQMWSPSGIQSATYASGGGSCAVGDVVTVTQSGAYAGLLQVATISPVTLTVYDLGFGYSTASNLATTGGTGCAGTLVVNITAGAGSNALATAYGQLEKWMVGATESCLHSPDGGWVCTFSRTSPSGYQAYAVWNDNGSGNYVVPTGVIQYRDLYGNKTSTTPGTVFSLTTQPLLFETANAW